MGSSEAKSSPSGLARVLEVTSSRRTELVEITRAVQGLVTQSGVASGFCHLYVPHTTAGILVNENDDPAVARDIEAALDRLVPRDEKFRHAEGNADSHVKSALIGVFETIPIEKGRLALGRWQGIFFCDFDGPRRREVRVKISPFVLT